MSHSPYTPPGTDPQVRPALDQRNKTAVAMCTRVQAQNCDPTKYCCTNGAGQMNFAKVWPSLATCVQQGPVGSCLRCGSPSRKGTGMTSARAGICLAVAVTTVASHVADRGRWR